MIMKMLCLTSPSFRTEHGRFSRTFRSPAIAKSGTICYPIWLGYTAEALEDAGFDVKVISSCACGYDLGRTLCAVFVFLCELFHENNI